MTWISLTLGRSVSRVVLYGIAAYFLAFAPAARRMSRNYLRRVLKLPSAGAVGWRHLFRHFLSFASAIHDRVYLLNDRFDLFDIRVHNKALIDSLAKPEDALVLLSEILNYDFAARPVDAPFTNEELKSINGLQGLRDKVLKLSGIANPTTADFVKYSGRATTREFPMFLGTPAAIADQMEEWFGETCDGFVVAPNVIPGTYDDFARLVVPELQRRGLAQKEYRGSTLRENLGAGPSFGVLGALSTLSEQGRRAR